MSKRVHTWSPTVLLVLLVVIQLVSSHLEGSIGEFHFTIPDVTGNFNDAVSWCKANNSTLAVVNDSYTQTALAQFLDSSHLTSTMFINIKLYLEQDNTWFLVNGYKYVGSIGNQNLRESNYLLYCRLRHVEKTFVVEASAPSDLRNYICDFEESRCSSYSTNNIINKGRCYIKFENENLTWYQARERCINEGADLARFQSESVGYFPPFNTSWLNNSLTYWIGIRFNNWSWKSPDSGSEYIYTCWSNGEPNTYSSSCACLDPNASPVWSWTDCDCSVERQFVCLKRVPMTSSIAVSTTTKTATTTNATSGNPTPSNCAKDENCVCLSTFSQPNKSEALTVGLVLGIGVIIPLIVIILVLVVANVHLRRQLRKKPLGTESVNHFAKTPSVTDDRSSAAAAASDTHYQHLQTDSRPATMMPLYDQLNQPETQEYETTILSS